MGKSAGRRSPAGLGFPGRTSSAECRRSEPALRVAQIVLGLLLFVPALAFAQTHTEYPGAAPAPANPALRVCADPNDLPFSNQAEEGFENKLAQMLGQSLGKPVRFVWHAQGEEFLRDTLNAGICDVVMGLPSADHAYGVLTTDPYYRSAYALVYRANAPYRLKSLDDPRLRTLQIGVHATGDDWVDLPGGATLAHRGIVNNVHVYKLFADYGRDNPSSDLIEAVAKGDVDVAIAWGPLAGYFARHQPVKLKVVPLVHAQTILPFEFSISMAVRHGNKALRDKLNTFVASHRTQIDKLLADYGVPQLDITHPTTPRLEARAGRNEARD